MWILLIIAGIGYKPVDNSLLLLCETELQDKNILLSQSDTLSKTKTDISWIITEPIGGAVGGAGGKFLGSLLGFGAGILWAYVNAFGSTETMGCMFSGIAIGVGIGYPVGVSLGICKTGKWFEKEEGSFRKTLIGAVIGEVIGLALFSMLSYYSVGNILIQLPIDYLPAGIFPYALPIIGGMIGYRLSLKEKK